MLLEGKPPIFLVFYRRMTMSKQALITSRDPKGLHAVGLFEAVYNKARLDDACAQRLNERGGELQDGIAKLIIELTTSDQYTDEEVESKYGYLSGYKPKPIAEQIRRLRELFPELKDATYDEPIAARPLPEGSEGWFAIPRWERLSKAYGEGVQEVLAMIAKTLNGKFVNYREGQTGPEYLRQHVKTEKMFQKLVDEQSGHDILVVPAQFGLRHRGESVRRAREVFTANEFGLGAFAVGIMLLTHPERLQDSNDLWIDCAGDEFAPDVGGRFTLAPCFGFALFRVGLVEFYTRWVGIAYDVYGSASGFLP